MKNLNLKIGSDFLYLDVDEMLKQVEIRGVNKEGENLFFMNSVDFSNLNKTFSKKDILIDHPLYSYILSVKNKNERGSDIIKKKSLKLN